jgi:hypothetical protein
MHRDEIDTLRRQAEAAYTRWRACARQQPSRQTADEECAQHKAERDQAAKALFVARRPSLSIRPGLRQPE